MISDAQKMRILREAIENGIIDIDSINVEMQKKKEKEYLENHTSSVWQSSNGFWYTYLTVDSKRKLVKRKNKQDLEQEIICYYKAKDPDLNPTFEQEYKAWIAAKKEYHEVKETSLLRYDTAWNKFLEGTEFSKTKMNDIDDVMLDEFIRKAIIRNNLTSKSYAMLRTILQGVLKYAKRYHHIDFSPSNFFKDIQIPKSTFQRPSTKRRDVYTKDERTVLFNYLMNNGSIRNLGLALMCVTGLRIGELATLKKSDNIENCRLLILRTETRIEVDGKIKVGIGEAPKMDHDGDIVIPKIAQRIIDLANMQTHDFEYLFSDSNGERIQGYTFRKSLRKACKEAGVRYKPPHQMRKTFASILLSSGVDEALVKKEMRHTDIATTRAYYQFVTDSSESEKSIIDTVIGL